VKGVSPAALEATEEATSSEEAPAGETNVVIPAAGDPLVISAIAQQWLWRFEYPGGTPGQRTFSYGELVVPVDTSVVLNIDSTDVIHSWWVPALGGQVQAVPGTISQTWFKADETGVFEGRGTVFNGTSFPAMDIRVRVVEPAEYQAYVEQLHSDLGEAQEDVRAQVAAASEAQAQAEEEGGP
jgi:cytochrome c oxidase subunit 2